MSEPTPLPPADQSSDEDRSSELVPAAAPERTAETPDERAWTSLPGPWKVLGYLVEDKGRVDNTVRLLRTVAVSLFLVLGVAAAVLWLLPIDRSAGTWAGTACGVVGVSAASTYVRGRRRRKAAARRRAR